MSKQLSFFFDYSSPFAYLGATQVERVARAHGAELRWRPFFLGGLFKAIGTATVPLAGMPAAKQAHMHSDLRRWAEHWQVPFSFPSRFPMMTVTALRMTLQLPDEKRAALVLPLFRAYWVEDRDIHDREVLAQLAEGAGFDAEELLGGATAADAKERLRQETDAAVALGICGAPSFLVKDEDDSPPLLFWGQDRLHFVEKALDGWRPQHG